MLRVCLIWKLLQRYICIWEYIYCIISKPSLKNLHELSYSVCIDLMWFLKPYESKSVLFESVSELSIFNFFDRETFHLVSFYRKLSGQHKGVFYKWATKNLWLKQFRIIGQLLLFWINYPTVNISRCFLTCHNHTYPF